MPWIRNATYDLFFFIGFWWPVVFLGLIRQSPWLVGSGLFLLFFHLLIRFPHFWSTYLATYLRAENWLPYRKDWIRYGLIPASILILYGLFVDYHSISPVSRLLILVSHLWGLQHIAFQNYGILQVYRSRETAPNSLRSLEKLVFTAIFALAVFKHDRFVSSLFPALTPITGYFPAVADACLTAVLFLCAFYLIRQRPFRRERIPSLLFMGSAVLTMTYWPFYDSWAGALGPVAFFYVYNGQHSINYIGLVSYMREQRAGRLSAGHRPFRFRAMVARFAALLLASAALYFLVTRSGAISAHASLSEYKYKVLGSLEGFFVLHYYLESISWKYRDPHARATMFSLLEPIPAKA